MSFTATEGPALRSIRVYSQSVYLKRCATFPGMSLIMYVVLRTERRTYVRANFPMCGMHIAVGSLINFGCLAGALLGGSFVDALGKKKGMFLGNFIGAIGWLLIVMVPSPKAKDGGVGDGWDGKTTDAVNVSTIHAMLMVARMAIGVGVGIICCSVNAYVVT